MACSFEREAALLKDGVAPVAGIDEAGRGPLAGPVVAAAVILPTDFKLAGLDDSKKLGPAKRETLYRALTASPGLRWSVAVGEVEEIDRLNILRATHEVMKRAVLSLNPQPAHALVDGLPVPMFPIPQTAITGGDGISMSIAAASILAKVTRDRIMMEWDERLPQYGFARHKGYATAYHLARLRDHGPSPIHRRSFSPVSQAVFQFG